MQSMQYLKDFYSAAVCLVRYNLKIIFTGKFIYFVMAAVAIFLLVTVLNLMDAGARPSEATVFALLLVPGILLIFYPIAFGIQNDMDNRMIEILFGIPDYRYKIWLLRLLLIFLVSFSILFILSLLSHVALTSVPVVEMVFQLAFPLLFFGCLTFMISTYIRNGAGTSVVMVVISIVFWLGNRSFLENHRKWDIFLNPFSHPDNMNQAVWSNIVISNRIYLFTAVILMILFALFNLQKREKFLQ